MAHDAQDGRYMARALQLAARGMYTTEPNPRVGCVLVRGGAVVGEGWHEQAGGPHAEIAALARAGESARGATAYVTLEPCCHYGRTPPCSAALIEAGIARVVVAMRDPNPLVAGRGLERLAAAGIAVECGVLAAQAEALNPGFVMRMGRGRPYVRCKIAMTLDGRTATATGESQWITAPEARRDAHRLRARSGAIMTGIGTVLADDPALTVRLGEADPLTAGGSGGASGQPLRVVLDSRLRTPPGARLLRAPGRVLIACACDDDASAAAALARAGAAVVRLAAPDGRVDLGAVLRHLAVLEINEVLLEAGATLNGALLAAGFVDELVCYMAPCLLGDGGRGMFRLPAVKDLGQSVQLEIRELRAVGADWRITARVAGAA